MRQAEGLSLLRWLTNPSWIDLWAIVLWAFHVQTLAYLHGRVRPHRPGESTARTRPVKEKTRAIFRPVRLQRTGPAFAGWTQIRPRAGIVKMSRTASSTLTARPGIGAPEKRSTRRIRAAGKTRPTSTASSLKF